MLYQLAAEAVLTLHFAIALFAVAGGIAVVWRPKLAWLHLPTLAWCSWVNLASWVCPLTPLEHALRARAGETGFHGSFIEQYIAPVLYPGGMTREVEILAGVALPVWNLLIYAWVVHRWRRAPQPAPGGGSPS